MPLMKLERSAQAEVRAGAAEADVRVGVAAHVERERVVEDVGVAVRRVVEEDELVALAELVDAIGLSQPAVSKHLRVLRDAGAVEARVDGPRRVYRLRADALRDVDDWLTPYRAAWAGRLDAPAHHLDDREARDDTNERRPRRARAARR